MKSNSGHDLYLPPPLLVVGSYSKQLKSDSKYIFGCDEGEDCGLCEECINKLLTGKRSDHTNKEVDNSNQGSCYKETSDIKEVNDEIWRRLINPEYVKSNYVDGISESVRKYVDAVNSKPISRRPRSSASNGRPKIDAGGDTDEDVNMEDDEVVVVDAVDVDADVDVEVVGSRDVPLIVSEPATPEGAPATPTINEKPPATKEKPPAPASPPPATSAKTLRMSQSPAKTTTPKATRPSTPKATRPSTPKSTRPSTLQCAGRLNGSTWGCGSSFASMDALRVHWAEPHGKACLQQFVSLRARRA